MLATDEVPGEPKVYFWMAARALSGYIGDFFFTGQNPDFW